MRLAPLGDDDVFYVYSNLGASQPCGSKPPREFRSMTRTLALEGRPNVGKSTLFNRLTRSRDALVADFARAHPGSPIRDGAVSWPPSGPHRYQGAVGEEVGIDSAMAQQTLQAVKEADRVMFLVDGRAGLTAGDELIAEQLRRMGREAAPYCQ